VGTGLYNVPSDSAAIGTNSASGLKFVTAGTVHALAATKSGSNAGNLVIAGGSFNGANLVATNKYAAATTCVRNIAIFSSVDGEDSAFANKWNELDGGCNGQVNTILSHGGFIYVGGAFTSCGRAQGSVLRLKYTLGDAVSTIGNKHWQTLGLGVSGATVSSLVENDGRIYVAGSFGSAAGLGVTNSITRWEFDGDDEDDFGDWEQVYSECFGDCDRQRTPNAFAFHPGVAQPNPALRYPSAQVSAASSMYVRDGNVYVHTAGSPISKWDGDNWSQLGNANVAAGSFYPKMAWNAEDNHLLVVGSTITSGSLGGASAGFDEWDIDEDNWVPGRGGFNGLNGAGASIKVINAGASATFSAVLLALVAAFALLF